MAQVGNTFYRYEDYLVSAGTDEWGEPVGPPHVRIRLLELRVVRLTPKCAVVDYYGQEKRILLSAHARFACETTEQALISYRRRKQSQVKILEAQLGNVRRALTIVEQSREKLTSEKFTELALTGCLGEA